MTPDFGQLTRRDLLRAGAGSALVVSGAGLLSACGGGSSPGTSTARVSQPAGGKPVRGGTLTVGHVTGGPSETIDPRKVFVPVDFSRTYSLYERLFTLTPDGVAPGLATEATPNTDATVWTIRLRPDVVWHDGKAFTAEDVVYSIVVAWRTAGAYTGPFINSIIDCSGVRKRDAHTVEIPLRFAMADLPSVICTYNQPIMQDGTKNYNNGNGTGPFKLASFTPGTQSVFKANPNYWQTGVPYVDTLIINSSFSSSQAVFNALLAGNIDIMPAVPSSLARAHASSGAIVLGNSPGPAFAVPTMHVTKAPFTDVRVRQAMRLLADRETIIRSVFGPYAFLGNDCPGYTNKYWASSLKPSYDPEKARALLKAAGQEKLALTLYTSDIVAGNNETATVYAQQASAAGVNVTVQVVPTAIYYGNSSPGGVYPNKQFSMNNWEVALNSLAQFYLQALWSKAPQNETGWGGPTADPLLFDALGELDPARAADKWLAVQKAQFDEGGYILTDYFNWLDGYSPKVRGIKATTVGNCDGYNYKTAWLAA
jgi:peptide/nickel transport system substrate-binding protein